MCRVYYYTQLLTWHACARMRVHRVRELRDREQSRESGRGRDRTEKANRQRWARTSTATRQALSNYYIFMNLNTRYLVAILTWALGAPLIVKTLSHSSGANPTPQVSIIKYFAKMPIVAAPSSPLTCVQMHNEALSCYCVGPEALSV